MKHPDKPSIREVNALCRAYYAKPGNSVGGILHAVLDDGNMRDLDLRDALWRSIAAGDHDASELVGLLILMSPTQRRQVSAWKKP